MSDDFVPGGGNPVSTQTETTVTDTSRQDALNTPKLDETKSQETETSESKTYDEAYVKKLRDEAAKHRTEKKSVAEQYEAKMKELEAQLKELKTAQLSEEEKRQQEFEETKEKLSKVEVKAREADLAYKLALAAKDANIVDLKAAVKLADRELIELADDGSVKNIDDVVKDLQANYPSVFNSTPNTTAPNTGATNPAKGPSAKKYTREDIVKMSPERRVELLEAGEFKHLL